ncbi:SSU ribosomal protein S21p [Helicobacter heilmannii ASB1.4]|nr:SSU ribosomal protein S21p [Helicobacter heilmannii ASB1.4]
MCVYLYKKVGDGMPGIKVRETDSFDEAYRRFKKQTDRNLVVTECRARRFFESKTEKRKKQKINAKKKILKRLYMLRRYESKL